MAVTMQDVARYAAVSTATVSRVLNNPEVVNEETRRQVLDAIKALNYRMNRTARSLRTSRTNRLAIVISDTGDPLVAQILEAFEDAAVRQHYAVQLCISHGDETRAPFYIEMLSQQGGVDGVMWMSTHIQSSKLALDYVQQDNTPILWVNSTSEPVIQFDYRSVSYQAASYLLEAGHRKIVLIVDAASQNQQLRMDGYHQALHEAEITYDSRRVLELNRRNEADCSAAITALLDEIERIGTAIIAPDDRFAAMIYRDCARRDLRIPQDISVIGCGDYPLLMYLFPALTTFRLPAAELGRMAFEILHCAIEENSDFGQPVLLQPELIERESVALLK